MLKKIIFILLSASLVLALAACSTVQAAVASVTGGNSNQQGTQTGANNGARGGPGGNFSNVPASPETRLAIGILKLEGTSSAVTTDQAKAILPLWKAMRTMASDTTASPAEITALDDQIKGVLTADQNDQIAKLDLSPQNMRTIMSSLGLEFGRGQNGTQTPNQTPQAGRSTGGGGGGGGGGFFPGGGGGGGGFPGGGGFGGGGTGANGQVRPTQSPAQRAARNRLNPFIANAVLQLLTKKAGA